MPRRPAFSKLRHPSPEALRRCGAWAPLLSHSQAMTAIWLELTRQWDHRHDEDSKYITFTTRDLAKASAVAASTVSDALLFFEEHRMIHVFRRPIRGRSINPEGRQWAITVFPAEDAPSTAPPLLG